MNARTQTMMPTAPHTKAEDRARYERGEIVRTTKSEWIEPLFELITKATGVAVVSIDDNRVNWMTDVNRDLFPEAGLWDRAMHFYLHYTVTLSNGGAYSIRWRQTDESAGGHPVLLCIDATDDRVLYNKYKRGTLSYPIRGCTTYEPLPPFLAHVIARDLINKGAVSDEYMITALECAKLLTPQLRHALATLKGVQSYVNKLTNEAIESAK